MFYASLFLSLCEERKIPKIRDRDMQTWFSRMRRLSRAPLASLGENPKIAGARFSRTRSSIQNFMIFFINYETRSLGRNKWSPSHHFFIFYHSFIFSLHSFFFENSSFSEHQISRKSREQIQNIKKAK